MRNLLTVACALGALGVTALVGTGRVAAADTPEHETVCDDGVDEDGDTVTDCGDADCFSSPACKPDGNAENTNARCSDWIDNDQDGFLDCDDTDCSGPGVSICKGSWDVEKAGGGATGGGGGVPALPEIPEGATFEDLIGKMGDVDGERNDFLCSDGIDNDGDGATDCADFGCRFDADVQVCRESPGMRFSVVAFINQSYDIEADTFDTRFSTLQLRAFGPMPFIQDSFFLVSMRAEKTPRLTFAMFQIPIGHGHYFNINSGGGGLSTAVIRSAAKQLLIDRPYYLYDAFEQGNGAAAEVGGQLDDPGQFTYRAYVAGGSGQFSGNVGGRFFTFDNTNFTWSIGGQIGVNLVGHLSRWASPMLYVKVPTALGLTAGVKYDQRAQERYPAWNVNLTLRSGGLIAQAETYMKRELEFGSWQTAWNLSAGYLIWPKNLLLVGDIGMFNASKMDHPPAETNQAIETDIRSQRDELQWRLGLHWYFFRNIGVLSLIYTDDLLKAREDVTSQAEEHSRLLELIAQYRF